MSDTLVLNADATPLRWMPLSTYRWNDAVKYLFEDRVTIIDHYDDWVVRSPSVRLNVPSVVMVREYVRPDYRVRWTKANVKLRDDYRCQYCNGRFEAEDLTIDHLVPQFHGGKWTWSNCVSACGACNRKKAHFLDMMPLTKPVRPTWGFMLERRKNYPLQVGHPSWLPFLNWPEDQVVPRWNREYMAL